MCSNYISCEGISLNQAHIVRNDDLRVEPSSSLVVSQSILTQHHLNLIKDLDEPDWTFASWPNVFRQMESRNYENRNEHLSVAHGQAFSVEHDLVQMLYHIWDFENQTEKWNGKVQMKKRGYPYILPSDINWENRSTKLDQRFPCGVTNSHNTFPPMRGRISQVFIRSGAKKWQTRPDIHICPYMEVTVWSTN